MRHICMFSGGVGSWAAAKRVAAAHGPENVTLLFADVGGRHTSPHAGEDEDCYRFIVDAAKNVGAELITLNQGLDIWEVFKKDRFLGNPRLSNCSKFLKRQPSKKWLEDNTTPDDAIVYVGIDWSEVHRIPAIEEGYAPWRACTPLTEPPYLDKDDMLAWCRAEGLEPPRMYAEGFPHANCNGGCVRAGHGQFKLLLEQRPEVFAYWEAQEQELRDYLGKDIAILRDRTKTGVAEYRKTNPDATLVPLTLRAFRERHEKTPEVIDADDIGGCGCFTD